MALAIIKTRAEAESERLTVIIPLSTLWRDAENVIRKAGNVLHVINTNVFNWSLLKCM